jgi:hypothetical protein
MVSCLIARGKAVTQAEFQRIVKMHPSAHFIREVCPCPLHHVQFIFAEGNCEQRLLFLLLNKDGFLFSSVTFMTVHLLVAKSTGFGSLNISKYQSNKFLCPL